MDEMLRVAGRGDDGLAKAVKTDDDGILNVKVKGDVRALSSKMAYRITDMKELVIPTYDGSGQSVHPSVKYLPLGFGGHQYWMVMTPFPGGDWRYENPSALYSDDGINWSDSGIANPIVDEPTDYVRYFNKDPELVYNKSTNELWIYWVNVDTVDSSKTQTYRKRSSDGITWSEQEVVNIVNNPASNTLSAFGITWTPDESGGCWTLYEPTDKQNTVYRHLSKDGLTWIGREYAPAYSNNATANYHHLSVLKHGNGYHFLSAFKSPSQGEQVSSNSSIHYGYSPDGYNIEWDTAPLLMPFNNTIRYLYRSSMIPLDGDNFRVYMSYVTVSNVWEIGYFDITLTGNSSRVSALGDLRSDKIEVPVCSLSHEKVTNASSFLMFNSHGNSLNDWSITFY